LIKTRSNILHDVTLGSIVRNIIISYGELNIFNNYEHTRRIFSMSEYTNRVVNVKITAETS